MKKTVNNSLFLFALIAIGCGGNDNTVSQAPPVQYRLRQIMIEPSVSPESEAAIRNEAESCLKRALAGEDFTILAKTLSQEPVAPSTGGDLGFFQHEQMVKEFSDAVFSMKEGEIAGPVKTQFGYHIIKLHAIDGEKRHAQHILFMVTPSREDSLAVIDTLNDVRKRIIDGADFGDMVERHTTIDVIRDTEGYMVWQTPDDMLPSFRSAVESLGLGDISEPFVSIIGFHIVMVDSINHDPERLLEGFPANIANKLENTNIFK